MTYPVCSPSASSAHPVILSLTVVRSSYSNCVVLHTDDTVILIPMILWTVLPCVTTLLVVICGYTVL